jgi:hypothetical protein
METLAIESTKPFSLDLIQRVLSQTWQVEASTANTLIVHGNKSRAYLHPDVTLKAPGTYRLLIDYSDVQFVKDLVERIADDPAVTVNNDFGTILPGNQFAARIKNERGWDWRS